VTPNFIRTSNPFGLAVPPTWFLRRLYAYDPKLVLFPSVCKGVYQMGRRAGRGQGMAKPLASLPDTAVFYAHRIYPWKEILASTIAGMSWQRVLDDLPCYDTEKVDDPTRAVDRLEEEDERHLDALIADGADQRAADFYKTLSLIGGSRIGYGHAAKKVPGAPVRRRRVHRPTAPSGAGAIWVGR
jgi:hypothetical protein